MSVEKVRSELMNKIDHTNEIEIEKVDRYINLLNIFYQLDESIAELGPIITTINAAQRFTKPNPAISEKNKISSSLLALEKSFNFTAKEDKKPDNTTKGIDALI